MNTKIILAFLKNIAANNNREWFQEHKSEYETVKKEFEAGVEEAITTLTTIDSEIAHLKVKDCTYRFYRDTRFSPDKSPYKRHLGAFICAKGRKALRGGYYIHLEPNNCLVAVGSYWLPTNILTSCRNEIMANIDQWRKIVEDGKFAVSVGVSVQLVQFVHQFMFFVNLNPILPARQFAVNLLLIGVEQLAVVEIGVQRVLIGRGRSVFQVI